jgi:uracil-DNA glycosylase
VRSPPAAKPPADQTRSITSFFGPPKPSPSTRSAPSAANGSAPAAPASKFDKDAWVATLTDEQRQLLALEINTLHESWLAHLKDELVTREFLQLKRFLKAEVERGATVFPPSGDVYAWSRHTPLHTVKVVILGQDPYHNDNQAHGLCFSVRPPTRAPPSLRNMYVALARDYPAFKPPPGNGGLLTPWARRGVLLLNSALTVRAHEANSHAGKGWERLTRRVVELVDRSRRSGVVFLAWGASAQERCAKVGARHLVLKSVHPSPLSAHRGFVRLVLLRAIFADGRLVRVRALQEGQRVAQDAVRRAGRDRLEPGRRDRRRVQVAFQPSRCRAWSWGVGFTSLGVLLECS